MFSTIMKSWRKALAAVMMVPMMFSIQGCTDGEALATIGAIAVIGGAIAIGASAGSSGGGHDHYRPSPPPHHRWGRHSLETMVQVDDSQLTDELNSIALMSARYNISMEAARALKATLKTSVENQTLQPIYDLGLSAEDLQKISQNQEITNSGLDNLSAKLNISKDQARSMVSQMMADAQSSQSNVQ